MSNLFGTFFVLYMLFMVVHGSIYSSKTQAIGKLREMYKKKGVNKKIVHAQINSKWVQIKWMKRIIWLVFIVLFLFHLLFISFIKEPEADVQINAVYLFVGVCVLLFVMNWLKSSSKVEKAPYNPS